MHKTLLDTGTDIIRAVQKTLPDAPGVYRMINERERVLYVGKAKSLKKRVASYTRPLDLPIRLQRMIAETRRMEIVETATELEALLLEFNFIKSLDPVYNIMLKDDKAYPYILVTSDHPYPRLAKHRGAKAVKGHYFGPFAAIGTVNRTLTILQKVFRIRNCTDSFFAARTRPCLQYHIKRCTAPCVGYVTEEEYAAQAKDARDFLKGRTRDIQERYAEDMRQASDAMEFERAARLRDQIKALSVIQASQLVNPAFVQNADVFALVEESGFHCIGVFFIRNGQNFGSTTVFPDTDEGESGEDVLSRFILQFYARNPAVPVVLCNLKPSDHALMADALSADLGRKVRITVPARGETRRLVDMAVQNAKSALDRHKAIKTADAKNLDRLRDLFGMEAPPRRIEVYDNSHSGGTLMVGAMIVAGPDGFVKSAYRKFNIREAGASDDYAMMREVMKRRFGRAVEEGKGPEAQDWPDLVLIDGGKGQLSAVTDILDGLGVLDTLTLVSIAKGVDRNAGREEFMMNGRPPFRLPVNDPALFYLQRLRDEAHRFAVGTMRARRGIETRKSPLDGVPGIGPKRKKALLAYFGSGKAVRGASIQDLEKVEGISKAVAKTIYDYFHP